MENYSFSPSYRQRGDFPLKPELEKLARHRLSRARDSKKGTGCFLTASDLMARENHIFTVVPRAAGQDERDWRLPVFEAGRYLVAFDGAALLLLELWKKGKGV